MDFDLNREQKEIAKAAREFAKGEFTTERIEEFERDENFDEKIWKKACELGFVGVWIDEKYDGAGLGFFENCLITEEFSAVDLGCALSVGATCFGSEIIQTFGRESQKNKYLPPLVSGEAKMGNAITEPDAGSDTAGAKTVAIRDGDDYVINGSKMFITNALRADYVLVFARTDPNNANPHQRHSFILVETDRSGYKAHKLRGKMGIRSSETCEITFSDVRVPISNLIGNEEGSGFKQLMTFFNMTRCFVAAQAVGVARAALEETIAYVKQRHVFGGPLARQQATQFKVAEMYTGIRASRAMLYEAAWKVDRGEIDHALVAAVKWYAARTAVKCADTALQAHGGYGYFADYKVNRLYRDAKILEIYEGTTDIEKIIIGRSLLR
jgi:alkylation response protein AidB-like acyl-CoA dehydrogenase